MVSEYKDKRKRVSRRLVEKYDKLLKDCNPYGYTDCQEYYNLYEYWYSIWEGLK